MELGILASGDLGYNVVKKLIKSYKINFIASDSLSIKIINFSISSSIPIFVGNPRKNKLFNFLNNLSCDFIVSINYLFILEKEIINFPRFFSFNLHGSLLPKYRGRTPHVWAIINGEKETGITAHLIDSSVDSGDIIFQKKIKISNLDTGFSILKKFKNEYIMIINKVFDSFSLGKIKFKNQNNKKATYFPKRNKSDGRINWNWSKEKIYNWVRAQSYPYPGAFAFYYDKKITIDWVDIHFYNYDKDELNGKIVKIINNNPIIKTSNGLLRIKKIRDFETKLFKENSLIS